MPDWLLLVLGAVLSLAGGLASQLVADSRAVKAEQRARQHERDVWARGIRYELHNEFQARFQRLWNIVTDENPQGDRPVDEGEFFSRLADPLAKMDLWASDEATGAATRAALLLDTFASSNRVKYQDVLDSFEAYKTAARIESGLPARVLPRRPGIAATE